MTPHHTETSPDTKATISLMILLIAAAVVFLTPHYLTLQPWESGPTLVLGDWTATEMKSEPWQVGDYGQLRHLRYVDGSTCTQVIAGPLALQLCR